MPAAQGEPIGVNASSFMVEAFQAHCRDEHPSSHSISPFLFPSPRTEGRRRKKIRTCHC